jgi:hypothetical protein
MEYVFRSSGGLSSCTELAVVVRGLIVEGHARCAMAGDVPFNPLPLYVRRARESGIAAGTCGHVFPLLSLVFSIGSAV